MVSSQNSEWVSELKLKLSEMHAGDCVAYGLYSDGKLVIGPVGLRDGRIFRGGVCVPGGSAGGASAGKWSTSCPDGVRSSVAAGFRAALGEGKVSLHAPYKTWDEAYSDPPGFMRLGFWADSRNVYSRYMFLEACRLRNESPREVFEKYLKSDAKQKISFGPLAPEQVKLKSPNNPEWDDFKQTVSYVKAAESAAWNYSFSNSGF
ncbi:hypothetical protein ACIQUL_29335 [Streptomyces sp. NPDC090303]|uniref:hypothetical protein n=1 Tax=Streptomyces sp. NPDC090303 TaxID=3365960 RepID=UPI003828293B